jgi:hypothetical protein
VRENLNGGSGDVGFRYHYFSTTIKAVTFDTVLDCNVVLLECEDEAPTSYGSHWHLRLALEC